MILSNMPGAYGPLRPRHEAIAEIVGSVAKAMVVVSILADVFDRGQRATGAQREGLLHTHGLACPKCSGFKLLKDGSYCVECDSGGYAR